MTNSQNNKLTIKDELTDFLLYTAPNGKVNLEAIYREKLLLIEQENQLSADIRQ